MPSYRFGVAQINWLKANDDARKYGESVADLIEGQMNEGVRELEEVYGPITIHSFTHHTDQDGLYGSLTYLYSYDEREE